MRLRATRAVAAVLLFLAPVAARADLTPYSQNFEGLTQTDPDALANDGWLVFGNVFDPAGTTWLYGYGPYVAPNTGAAFSAIDLNQGGLEQGLQQLSVYSDYNNTDHALLRRIESNVFQEQTIGSGDVGNTWVFQFDAKLGNLAQSSTALAFIKTLDPGAGYALTNFVTVNTTAIPTTWATYSITIPIDAGLVGQILQIGFLNNATNYEPSGVFYDNISWGQTVTGVGDAPQPVLAMLHGAAPSPFRESTRIDYSVAKGAMVNLAVYDVTGRRVATLFQGYVEAGSHAATWNGRLEDGRAAPAGIYRCVLQTAGDRQSRSVVLTR